MSEAEDEMWDAIADQDNDDREKPPGQVIRPEGIKLGALFGEPGSPIEEEHDDDDQP